MLILIVKITGTAALAERFADGNFPLMRFNPYAFEINCQNIIAIPLGAKESMLRINEYMNTLRYPF